MMAKVPKSSGARILDKITFITRQINTYENCVIKLHFTACTGFILVILILELENPADIKADQKSPLSGKIFRGWNKLNNRNSNQFLIAEKV